MYNGSAAPRLSRLTSRTKDSPGAQAFQNANSVRSNQRIRRKRKSTAYDLPYVIMLTIIASLCTLYLCELSASAVLHHGADSNAIERMEADLGETALGERRAETPSTPAWDLESDEEIATRGELGMVYANKNQVLLVWTSQESEYVRQYEDIPEYFNCGKPGWRPQ